MTLTGTIPRRRARGMRVFFFLSFPFLFFFPFFHLLVQYFTLSFIFYAPLCFIFFTSRDLRTAGLAFLVWLVGGGVYGRHWQAA
jgi:hypothetical protein